MKEWASSDVIANGIRLHTYRTGDGSQPPVVLSHGITDNGLCWTAVAEALEDEYDVIMYDTRGHGLSEKPWAPYDWRSLADDLAGLIDALKLDRPLVMGHSLGAATAMVLAAEYPTKTRAVILEDPPCRDGGGPQGDVRAFVEARRQELKQLKELSKDALLAHVHQRSPNWPEIELEAWVLAKQQVSPDVAELYGVPRPDWRQMVAKMRCPSLWLTADPTCGAIVTPEVAVEVKGMLPTAEVVYIEGAGHSIHRERFEPVMAAVKSFLREHAQD